jgi:hypothetical protein
MNNVIAIEVLVANLLAGLRPAAAAEAVSMKLTKRDSAQYLRAETKPRDGGVGLVQDIPVRVIGSQEMMRYAPPVLPSPAVQLCLPPPRALGAVVDRMKALGKALHIEADGGEPGGSLCSAALTLGVDSDQVRVRTFYRELKDCRPGGSSSSSSSSAVAHAACIVSIKDFARTLRGIAAIGSTVAVQSKLAIVPGTALFLHVELEDGTGTLTVIHTIFDTTKEDEEQEQEAGGQEEQQEEAAGGGAEQQQQQLETTADF